MIILSDSGTDKTSDDFLGMDTLWLHCLRESHYHEQVNHQEMVQFAGLNYQKDQKASPLTS